MYVVDSCGWLEWFTDGPLAERYGRYLRMSRDILVPSIILYEVYKVLKREVGEEKALLAVGYMKNSEVIDLDETGALQAADVALQYNLAMADAVVYAVALSHRCKVITSDSDYLDLPNVKLLT
jgi:predicted nucleic acid-binding protein